jgi:hypothetical protein
VVCSYIVTENFFPFQISFSFVKENLFFAENMQHSYCLFDGFISETTKISRLGLQSVVHEASACYLFCFCASCRLRETVNLLNTREKGKVIPVTDRGGP